MVRHDPVFGHTPPRAYRHQRTAGQAMLWAMEALILATAAVLSCVASTWITSPAWSLVALAICIWAFVLVFRMATQATVLAAPVLLVKLSTFVALVSIEFGSRIPELGTAGAPGAAATSYLLVTLLGLAVYIAAFRLIGGRAPRSMHRLTPLFDRYADILGMAMVGLVGLLILALLARGALTGFPLLTGMDRFQYRRETDLVTLYTLNNKGILLLLTGMVAFRLPVLPVVRLLAAGVSVLLLGSCFLFGDKFFSQIGGVIAFLTPYLYVNHANLSRRPGRIAAAGLLILAIAIGVTWFIYSANGAMTTAATLDRLSGRIVGQGEIWWQQVRVGNQLFTWNGEFVTRNIQALKVKEIELYALQNSLGPDFFSNKYAPLAIRLAMLHGGGIATYTVAFEALLLANFGWFGLIAGVIATSVLLAVLTIYIAFAIRSRSLISVALSSFVFFGFNAMTTQGTPWVFFGFYAIKWYAVAMLIEIGLMTAGSSQRRPAGRYGGGPFRHARSGAALAAGE